MYKKSLLLILLILLITRNIIKSQPINVDSINIDRYEIINYCNSILESNPNNYYYFRVLGDVYTTYNDYSNALINYEKYLQFDSENLDVQINKGLSLFALDLFKDAIRTFNFVLIKDSIRYKAYLGRAACFYAINNYNNCIIDCKKIIDSMNGQIGTNDFVESAYYNRTLAFYELNNYTNSIIDINILISNNPLMKYYLQRGKIFMKMGELENAFKDFTLILKNDKINPSANYFLAEYFYMKKDYTKACYYLSISKSLGYKIDEKKFKCSF